MKEELKYQPLKATRGPWEAEITEDGIWVTGPDRDAPVICDIVPRITQYDEGTKEHTPVPQEEDEANAKILAASRELLEALESMVNIFDRDLPANSIGRRICDEAIKAIQKATETTPEAGNSRPK